MHLSTGCHLKSLLRVSSFRFRSVLGEVYSETPMILPIRGHLDSIARLMVGGCCIGRGCRQRGLPQSPFCNDFKVAVFGREEAHRRFSHKLLSDNQLRDRLWTLSGLRSVCHCKLSQHCHGDVILREFKLMFPARFRHKVDVPGCFRHTRSRRSSPPRPEC